MLDERIDRAWWVLRIGLGVGPILAGLDKYFNLLANWEMYLNPLVPTMLHIQAATFMHIVGAIEMAAGIAVLTRYTRYAAYVVMAWLWCIALKPDCPGSILRRCRARPRDLARRLCAGQAVGSTQRGWRNHSSGAGPRRARSTICLKETPEHETRFSLRALFCWRCRW